SWLLGISPAPPSILFPCGQGTSAPPAPAPEREGHSHRDYPHRPDGTKEPKDQPDARTLTAKTPASASLTTATHHPPRSPPAPPASHGPPRVVPPTRPAIANSRCGRVAGQPRTPSGAQARTVSCPTWWTRPS